MLIKLNNQNENEKMSHYIIMYNLHIFPKKTIGWVINTYRILAGKMIINVKNLRFP